MAIGGNNFQNQPKTVSTRSKITLFNEGQLNYTCLKFECWNGLLALKIEPCIKTTDGDVKVDSDNNISIYLTPLKCKILYNAINEFLSNPTMYKNVGINSSNGLVTFSYGDDYNISGTYVLSIRKIDENGNILSSNSYEFNNSKMIINFDDSNPSENIEEFKNNIEVGILLEALNDFSSYANTISAYWNEYTFEYQKNKRAEMIKSIADKLGVDTGYKSNNNTNNSFFKGINNKQQNVQQSKNVEIDSLEDMM